MKTIIQRTIGMTAFCLALSAAAQTELTTVDTTAELIPWNVLPATGTIWVESQGGSIAPYPCPPQYMPGASVYALSDGTFAVDARTVQNKGMQSMSATSSMAPPPPRLGGWVHQPIAQARLISGHLERLV